jgi:hypothetical protein
MTGLLHWNWPTRQITVRLDYHELALNVIDLWIRSIRTDLFTPGKWGVAFFHRRPASGRNSCADLCGD